MRIPGNKRNTWLERMTDTKKQEKIVYKGENKKSEKSCIFWSFSTGVLPYLDSSMSY